MLCGSLKVDSNILFCSVTPNVFLRWIPRNLHLSPARLSGYQNKFNNTKYNTIQYHDVTHRCMCARRSHPQLRLMTVFLQGFVVAVLYCFLNGEVSLKAATHTANCLHSHTTTLTVLSNRKWALCVWNWQISWKNKNAKNQPASRTCSPPGPEPLRTKCCSVELGILA